MLWNVSPRAQDTRVKVTSFGVAGHGSSLFINMKNESAPQFWFNLKSLKVEKGLLSAAPHRVGPFATEAEARDALKLLAQRSQQWRDEERERD